MYAIHVYTTLDRTRVETFPKARVYHKNVVYRTQRESA